MSRVLKAVPLVVLCAFIVAVPPVWANWVQDGVAICTATGGQGLPTITSDGAGGAIVTWYDGRNGNWDIHAQRVNASGAVQWTANGVALCTATGNQYVSESISDGAGGAIVTWTDNRRGAYEQDIYAQRVNALGAVQWTANGVALCTATRDQSNPTITSDGAGGAIVMWQDNRTGNNADIYAQRVNALGAVQWTADGVAVCTAAEDQWFPAVVSDADGGAIVTWQDSRSRKIPNIYAQRVDGAGTVRWTAGAVALCKASGKFPRITSDGAGGAIVTWEDSRSGNDDIYAQRVNASGAVQWTADGAAICTATENQAEARIAFDDAGGAIITWQDGRNGNWDIYAQRVNASGVVQWTADGVALCTATGTQQTPTITSDGLGGAIVTWADYRSGSNWDVYGLRVDANGSCALNGH
jgi:hypothetical protein